jgi:hypothetical protein
LARLVVHERVSEHRAAQRGELVGRGYGAGEKKALDGLQIHGVLDDGRVIRNTERHRVDGLVERPRQFLLRGHLLQHVQTLFLPLPRARF